MDLVNPPSPVNPPLFSGDRPEKNRVESNDVIRGLFWPAAGAEKKSHFWGVFRGETLQNSYFFRACGALQPPNDVIWDIPRS